MTVAKSRHQWDKPQRYPHKTERVCLKCGLVKVTRHEAEGPRDLHWMEYWRGGNSPVPNNPEPLAE